MRGTGGLCGDEAEDDLETQVEMWRGSRQLQAWGCEGRARTGRWQGQPPWDSGKAEEWRAAEPQVPVGPGNG